MTAREPKPSWQDVPERLREKIAVLIGEPVAADAIAWGGYSPSATFVLTTASGRRVFCKGTHPGQTEIGHKALLSERRTYERLPELARFGPAYLGGADHEDWHMAVLEYVPRGQDVPPWTDAAAEQALTFVAGFHAASPACAASELKPFAPVLLKQEGLGWRLLSDDAERRGRFIALFEDADAAARWFARHIDCIVALESEAATIGGPQGWLHLDTRSDNLVFTPDGRIVLVDWPSLAFGPALFDVAAFLPSLEGEGGPRCAEALKIYERLAHHSFDPADVARAAAHISGYFAARAGEPMIAGLPRLRWIQTLQLFPALRWLAHCAALDPPPVPRALEA